MNKKGDEKLARTGIEGGGVGSGGTLPKVTSH